jgi:hypothetical protein
VNFKHFLEHNPLKITAGFSQNTVGKHNDYATGAFLPSTWTGSETIELNGLPSTDLKLPIETFKSKVSLVKGAGPGDVEGSREKARDVVTVVFQNGNRIDLNRTSGQLKRFCSVRPLSVGQEYSVTLYRNSDGSPGNILKVT